MHLCFNWKHCVDRENMGTTRTKGIDKSCYAIAVTSQSSDGSQTEPLAAIAVTSQGIP
jgi:hypothetical protein